ATFICEAKTLILDDNELVSLRLWGYRLRDVINMHAPSSRADVYAEAGYYRNLGGKKYWRIRKAIEQAIASIARLHSDKVQTVARCVVLRTAQW
uniref:hypothetical protein n=1 Tax=Escherichia coli TaxID=562 RepID=UPI00200CA40A